LKSPHLKERAQSDWIKFKGCVIEWQVVLGKLVKRWGSMAKMKSVLGRLADGVMDSVESNKLPEGHSRQQHHSPRKERHDTRLALEELSAPLELSRKTRSPQSGSQSQASPRKRRRGISTIGDAQARKEDPSPTALDVTPPSLGQMPQSQLDNGYYPWMDSGEHSAGGLDNIDFPSVLGGELFTDIDQLGAPLQLDLSLFDQPTEYMADVGTDPFGFQWMGARLDTTLTDSVLNFRGGMDESTQPGDGTGYPPQYQ
jgi:hypothetical protein